MADVKPPFDPNKPFIEAQEVKPAFDPNKEFEPVDVKKKGNSVSESPSPDGTLSSPTRSSFQDEGGPNDSPVVDRGTPRVVPPKPIQPPTPYTPEELNLQAQKKVLDPQTPKDMEGLAKITEDKGQLQQEAYIAAQKGNPAITNAVADILIQKHPDDIYGHELKAHQLEVNKDYVGAAKEITKAIGKHPDNPMLRAKRAELAYQAGLTTTAKEDADAYLKSGEYRAGNYGDAVLRSRMSAISGDKEGADYWKKVSEGIESDRQKGIEAQNIIDLSNWMGQKFAQIGSPITLPAEMVMGGVEKMAEGVEDKSPAKVASGAISTFFGAMGATPAGAIFNSVIGAGQLVGAGDVIDWGMAPASKLLQAAGFDESKFSETGKLVTELVNFIPMTVFMHGYESGKLGVMKTAQKLADRLPLDGTDLFNIDEAFAASTPESVRATAELMDKQKAERQAAHEVSAVQRSHPEVATYRIDDKLYPKEEFVSELEKRKEAGLVNTDREVVGDPQTQAVVDDMFAPKVATAPQEESVTPVSEDVAAVDRGKVSNDVPDVVYHGTNSDFTAFDESKMGATDAGWYGKGFYFHTDPNRGGYGDRVIAVKPKLENPLVLPVERSGEFLYDLIGKRAGLDRSFRRQSDMNIIREIGSDKFTEIAKELGYDGVVVNYAQGTKEVVVFDKNKIDIVDQNINAEKPIEATVQPDIPKSDSKVKPDRGATDANMDGAKPPESTPESVYKSLRDQGKTHAEATEIAYGKKSVLEPTAPTKNTEPTNKPTERDQIMSAQERLNSDMNYTFNDFVNEVEGIATDKGVLKAIEKYRKEQAYDRSTKGRGDTRGAEIQIEQAVEKYNKRQAVEKPTEATVQPKVTESETGQTSTPSAPDKLPSKPQSALKSTADHLRSLKIDKGLSDPTTMGVSDVDLWNKALDAAADVLEATDDAIKAMSEGLKYLKDKTDIENFKKAFDGLPPSTEKKEVLTGEEATKTRHEDTAHLRDEAGIGEYIKQPQKMADIEAEVQRQKKTANVDEIIAKVHNGEAVNPVEHGLIRDYVLGLRDKVKADPSETNMKLYEEALEANDLANSMSGRSLRSIQNDWNPEDSQVDMMIENKRTIGTKTLTEAQKSANIREFEEIDKLKQQLKEKTDEAMKLRSQMEAEKALREQAKKIVVNKKATHEEYVAERKKITQNIKDKWNKSRLGTLNSMVVPLPYANQLYAIAPDVMALAKSYLSEGISNLKDVTKRIKDDLDIPEVTEKDIHDIIAGEYSAPKKNRSDLATKLQNLKREAKYINELDALENGREPKTEGGKIKRNKEVSEVKKKIDEIRKAQGLGRWSEESKLATRKAQMKSEMAKIEKELASSKPITAKRPEPIKLDKEGQEIQDKLIAARQRRKARILQEKYESRTWMQKATRFSMDLFNGATRGIMATADLSMALLQNGAMAFTHPVYWGKSFGGALRDMVNEKKYNRWMSEMQGDRRFHIAKEAGLSVTDPKDQTLRDAEELFMSNLLDKIPVLGKPVKIGGKNYLGITQASERVFSSMSNRIRINMMYDLIDVWEQQGKTMYNSPELYKATARMINAATGRAKFGKFETDARMVSNILWSPRMYASQLELLSAPFNPLWKAPMEVRKQVWLDATKYVAVSISLMALAKAAGADVETDPRSKDFGKIKIGNTRIGMPGGMTQWITFVTQMAMGQTKSTVTGRVKDMGPGFAEQSRIDVAGRFLRGKLSPTLSLAFDLADGRTYMGDDILTTDHVLQYTTPLGIRGAFETSQNEGIGTGIWTGLLSSTGLPIQTYPKTGVYPTKDYSVQGAKFNALGENPNQYDKELWKFMSDNKIDVSPPVNSAIKMYDEQKGKMVKLDSKQYAEFIKVRGSIMKESLTELSQEMKNYKQDYISEIMDTEFADGERAVKSKEMATKIFNDVVLPEMVRSITKKATEEAREQILGEKTPSQKERDIREIVLEYKDVMKGK